MSRIVAVTASTIPEGGSNTSFSTSQPLQPLLRVRVNAAYITALKNAGLIPVVIPPLEAHDAIAVLDGVAGLVLTGGEDVDPAFYGEQPHPKLGETNRDRDESEIALIKEAAHRKLPTLAICRGIQVLNVALGGTLIQDIPSQIETTISHSSQRDKRTHDIAIEPGSLTAVTINATNIKVNSSHHQSIGTVAPELRITARAPDGVIEAVEPTDKNWWMLGVQWHPEELSDATEPWDRALFTAFAEKINSISSATPPIPAASNDRAN